MKRTQNKKLEFLNDRAFNICKSVNEMSKWDGFYQEYSERLKEVSVNFPQASNSAVSNLKNIPIMTDITTGAIARFQNKLADKSPNFKSMLFSRSQTQLNDMYQSDETNIESTKTIKGFEKDETTFVSALPLNKKISNQIGIYRHDSRNRLPELSQISTPSGTLGFAASKFKGATSFSQAGFQTLSGATSPSDTKLPILSKNVSMSIISSQQK